MAYTFKKFDKNDYADVTQAEKKAAEYDTYARSDEVSSLFDKKNTYEANNNPGEWDADANGWQELLKAQDASLNRKAFSYDLNGDALYQQYKDKFINQGRLAMADTIGQASAMTGGYGSSYAVTAGNQAYQSHLQNLNDIVPQLYQMALDKYNQEGQDLKDAYSMLNNTYQTKYGEHMDKTNIYNTTLDRLTSEAYNAQNFDYGQWSDNRTYYTTVADNLYNRAFNEHNTNETNALNAEQQRITEDYQNAQLNISQRQLELQEEAAKKAAETDSFEGLSFEDSEKLKEMYTEKDWDSINRYIASLNLSSASTKQLAEIWLPESYRNPLKGLSPTTISNTQFKNRFSTNMKN